MFKKQRNADELISQKRGRNNSLDKRKGGDKKRRT